MIIFAQGHQQVFYGLSLASAVFDGVEMRTAYLEASSNEVDDLSWPKIQQLQLVITLLNFAVFYLRQSALRHTCAHLMLMFYIAPSKHQFSFFGIAELKKGLATFNFAFKPISSFSLSGDQRFLDFIGLVYEVMVLEQDIKSSVNIAYIIELLAKLFDIWEMIESRLNWVDIEIILHGFMQIERSFLVGCHLSYLTLMGIFDH